MNKGLGIQLEASGHSPSFGIAATTNVGAFIFIFNGAQIPAGAGWENGMSGRISGCAQVEDSRAEPWLEASGTSLEQDVQSEELRVNSSRFLGVFFYFLQGGLAHVYLQINQGLNQGLKSHAKTLQLRKTPWVCSPGVKLMAAASKESGEEGFEVPKAWDVWMPPKRSCWMQCQMQWDSAGCPGMT